MLDLDKFTDGIAGLIKQAAEDATAPLIAETRAIMGRLAELEKRLDALPTPRDGAPGRDGKDADPEEVASLVHERIKAELDEMRAAIAASQEPQELPDIPALVKAALDEAVALLPRPKDGEPGPRGEPGPMGPQGEKGADGVGMAGAVIDRDGNLVITLTNGETKMLGPVVGKDGAPGRDGADGLGFDDMSFDFDDAGRPVATFSRGDVVKSVRLPCIIDRGVYKPDAAYLKGDAVSYGGSLWIAQKDAPEGRPDGSPDWRLAVKKGRDGRDVEAKKVL